MKVQSKEKTTPFNISIWRRATIDNRHARERQRMSTVDKVWQAIEQLSHTYQWERIYLFGSVTKAGQFSERSDIDVGIKGLDKFLHYRFIADLSGLLKRKVDVVRLEDCSFSEAIKERGVQWKRHK